MQAAQNVVALKADALLTGRCGPKAFDVLAAAGVPQVKTGYVADAGQLRRIGEDGAETREWHDGQYFVEHLLVANTHDQLLCFTDAGKVYKERVFALPDLGPAPAWHNETWINSEGPLLLQDLRGKVVLLEFWTFG